MRSLTLGVADWEGGGVCGDRAASGAQCERSLVLEVVDWSESVRLNRSAFFLTSMFQNLNKKTHIFFPCFSLSFFFVWLTFRKSKASFFFHLITDYIFIVLPVGVNVMASNVTNKHVVKRAWHNLPCILTFYDTIVTNEPCMFVCVCCFTTCCLYISNVGNVVFVVFSN